ncbi:MAG: extracellular solute-binding protein [Limnochordales bacterium]|nr:extracellular solute-binding protein [Limnochordales bacterium]
MQAARFFKVSAIIALLLALATASASAAVLSYKERPVRVNQKPVKLVLWHYWGAQRQDMVQEMIDRFQKAYPWITVQAVPKSTSGMRDEIITSIVSGTPPDVIMLRRYEVPSFAYEGLLLPIDSFLAERKLNPAEHFYPQEMNGFVVDGKTYSMPGPTGGATVYLIAYNRDMFEQVGLVDRAPQTWDEFETFAAKLNKWDPNRGFVQIGITSNVQAYLPLLYSNNGRYISDDGRKVYLTSVESIEVLNWMANFTQKINRGLSAENQFLKNIGNPTIGAFWAGYQGMFWANVSIFWNRDEFAPKMRMGVGLFPRNGRRPGAGNHGVVTEGWGYVIPVNIARDKQYAAYLLLEWLTAEPEGAGVFMLKQKRPSPIRGFNTLPVYYQINEHWDIVLKALESDVAIPIPPVYSDMLRNVLIPMATDVISGTSNAQSAAERAQQLAQQMLDSYWANKKK